MLRHAPDATSARCQSLPGRSDALSSVSIRYGPSGGDPRTYARTRCPAIPSEPPMTVGLRAAAAGAAPRRARGARRRRPARPRDPLGALVRGAPRARAARGRRDPAHDRHGPGHARRPTSGRSSATSSSAAWPGSSSSWAASSSEMPDALVQEARRLHLPLIALHEEVRFVEVTKQLHTAILTRQLTVERRVTELHAQLSGARPRRGRRARDPRARSRGRSATPCCSSARPARCVFHAAHEAVGRGAAGRLGACCALRVDAGEPTSPRRAPVTASGGRAWGRLVAVPHERPLDGLAVTAIERTAPLVAIALAARAARSRCSRAASAATSCTTSMAGRIAAEDIAAARRGSGCPGRTGGCSAWSPRRRGGARAAATTAARRSPARVREALHGPGLGTARPRRRRRRDAAWSAAAAA